MHILVTGGVGFIGSHLVRRLLREDHTVSILDTFHVGRPGNLGDAYRDPRCVIVQGSVTNWDAIRRAMRGALLVYHLAARSDRSSKPRHPAAVIQTNVMGTAWVLTMARALGVPRVIFTSSAAVYGDVFPGEEGGPCKPCSVYGASKLAAEAVCQGFVTTGLEVVTLRLFNVHGPGGHGVVDIFKWTGGPPPPIYGDGLQTRDFVHVSDAVDALIAAQTWDAGIYNVGTGEETSVLDLWERLRGDEVPTFAPPRLGDAIRNYADITRTTRLWRARRKESVK